MLLLLLIMIMMTAECPVDVPSTVPERRLLLSDNIVFFFLFSVLPHFSISIEPESSFIGHKNFNNFEITIKAR